MKLKSLFQQSPTFTNTTTDLSPAEKASQAWDAREGQIIEQNYNLRRITVGLMVTIVLLGGALCYKAFTENYLVYVVETDIKTGEVRNVGTVSQMENYKPGDQVYAYFIRQFVTNTRSLPLDEVVYKKQMRDAYAFLTKDGARVLENMMAQEKRQPGRETIQVAVTSVLPMEGGKSYQVRWQETHLGGSSNKSTTDSYTGVFTVETIKSDDKEQLQANPLGLYISDFRWEKDLNGSQNSNNKDNNTAPNKQ